MKIVTMFASLIAVASLAACDTAPAGSVTQNGSADAAPATIVSAKEISAAFQENEVKAKMAFGDKRLQVTGVIKDIELDFADNPVVKLRGANDVQNMGVSESGKITDLSVSGLSKEVSSELKKGDEITVICANVDEVMGSAQLSECQIAPSSDKAAKAKG